MKTNQSVDASSAVALPITHKEEVKAAMAIMRSVYEAIVASGSRGIPSGHLYAMLMGKMDLGTYQSMIGMLKRTGLVTEENFLLLAKSPGASERGGN